MVLPIYEYQCNSCGKHFENIQRITEEPLTSCPFCTGQVRKLVSNCSFQLKGTGWYVTDYGNGKKTDDRKEKQERGEAKKEEKTEISAEKGKDAGTAKETAVNQ